MSVVGPVLCTRQFVLHPPHTFPHLPHQGSALDGHSYVCKWQILTMSAILCLATHDHLSMNVIISYNIQTLLQPSSGTVYSVCMGKSLSAF